MSRKLFLIIIFITFSSFHLISKSELYQDQQMIVLANHDSENTYMIPSGPPFMEKTKEGIEEILLQYTSYCKMKKKEPVTSIFEDLINYITQKEEEENKFLPLPQDQIIEIADCYMKYDIKEAYKESRDLWLSRTRTVSTSRLTMEKCSEAILLEDMEISCSKHFFDLAETLKRCINDKRCHLIRENGVYGHTGYGAYTGTFIVFPFPDDGRIMNEVEININLAGHSEVYYPAHLSHRVNCNDNKFRDLSCSKVDFPQPYINILNNRYLNPLN
ncbi:MAG: hypothetical protein OXC37_04460 [Bdellovibrionaceae bacterium]|nr:hypothetical protein [Pseudobdellovibrionaceae bacterium]